MAVEAEVSNVFLGVNDTRVLSDFLGSPDHRKVHNHLLDTKIYATIGENDIFHIRPSSVHFQGFTTSRKYTQKLRIINASSGCQQLHIIPPTTKQFQIKYTKSDSLVPGMYLNVTVEFYPTENRYHCDSIRIHTKGFSNLIVPIHAYQIINVASSFPSKINFSPTLVGSTAYKTIPLRNDTATEFDFQLSFVQNNKSFDVKPQAGILPPNDHVNITISYNPQEYSTAVAKIQVLISQFNSKPYYCVVTGSCEPGLASKLKSKELSKSSIVKTDIRVQSPLERSRSKKQPSKIKPPSPTLEERETGASQDVDVKNQEISRDGIRFPKNLDNPAAVAYVLNQHPSKLKAKELKQAINTQPDNLINTKQMKEAIFEQSVSRNIAEEQRNQLRWCVKLGEESTSDAYQRKVIIDRQTSVETYHKNRGDPELTDEYDRSCTCKNMFRIRRQNNMQTEAIPTFDLYLNDNWNKRHKVVKRFKNAVRKIIIRNRVDKPLRSLHTHLDAWRRGNFASTVNTKPRDGMNKEQSIVNSLNTQFEERYIKPFAFPEYTDPMLKDDMAVDSLGSLNIPPSQLIVRKKVDMYNLKVPQQYKVLSYDYHPHMSTVYKYVPKKLARELRTGAESEVTAADVVEPNLPIVDVMSETTCLQLFEFTTNQPTVPSAFLQTPREHPLHIFNPLPGVQVQPQPRLYCETDNDHRLNPLPQVQPGVLDRQDVIPGAMTWKKFQSQAMIVMTNPSLCNIYVPRWSDPFGEEMCPTDIPTLLKSLPHDDVMEADDDDDECGAVELAVPTMEMVRAEFKMVDEIQAHHEKHEKYDRLAPETFPESLVIPATNNPQSNMGMVTRDKLMADLDTFLRNRQNNLGGRVTSRLSTLKDQWKLY